MSGLQIQDTFEPYYAGRKNRILPASAPKVRNDEREESAEKVAERTKASKIPAPARNVDES